MRAERRSILPSSHFLQSRGSAAGLQVRQKVVPWRQNVVSTFAFCAMPREERSGRNLETEEIKDAHSVKNSAQRKIQVKRRGFV